VKVLLRTNDIVLISAVEAILKGAKIEYFIADTHTSIMEGSAGAIPRRLLVAENSFARAQKILTEAGFAQALAES
jgi:hypothetical protein